MKVVMTLLVRDEADIVRANLDYHLSVGVDEIIVTDNLSTDGTRDLLRPYEDDGVVRVIEETADDYSQAEWVTRMARLAAGSGADWVINNDADEFWWTGSRNLADVLGAIPTQFGVARVHRHDFVPLLPETSAPFHERMIYRKRISTNALGAALPPKIAHRGVGDVKVAQGNHAVTSDCLGQVLDGVDIDIFHFPMRSYAQFERKIRNGGRAYNRNTRLSPRTGSTWRHLYTLLEQDRLQEHYAEQALPVDRVQQALADAEIVVDCRLRDHLRPLYDAEPMA